MKRRHVLFCSLLFLSPLVDARADQRLVDATIVVYNANLPESVSLAKFYAQQRGIARDHLVGLDCPTDEEITRVQYDETIANPLREICKQRGWWTVHDSGAETAVVESSIRIVALIKGIPLKIRSVANYPGDKPGPGPVGDRNEASVDSELTVLASHLQQVSGVVANPYFQSFRPIADFEIATVLLVCRLDAPSAATVRRMIVDSIAAEKKGLWGRSYIDTAHNTTPGLSVGDDWLSEIVGQCRKVGIPVVHEDTPEIFPEAYPMTDCALYYGWYTENMAGPFVRPDFRFVPGAIAVHIHSFSARTLRDPNAAWVGPLLTKGAAASLGNVYEPYLQFTAQLDIFNDRLLHGFSFAESAYMSMRVLSWMSVMVGDPLYRPYASWLQVDSGKTGGDWQTYHEFATKNSGHPTGPYQAALRETAMRTRNGAMMEDLGLLEAGDEHFTAATSNFQLARIYYKKREDIVRVVLEESEAWLKLKKTRRALELIRTTLRTVPDSPAAPLLVSLERQIIGKPSVSPTPTPPH
jgi:uncharacterized protein (TIGR03790 family)